MLKVKLYALAKIHRQRRRYLANEEATKRGHIVLRLPPYLCQYNPIELIWALLQRHYDMHILYRGKVSGEMAYIESVTPEICDSDSEYDDYDKDEDEEDVDDPKAPSIPVKPVTPLHNCKVSTGPSAQPITSTNSSKVSSAPPVINVEELHD
ncbi:hypothetical protein FOCC_FOCC007157 [Frankliniella occidentalis]|nr:hypothetical protein FOCC_FOCC007157 [Frankliniella occidentalis]